jgi:NAD(P)-dependent dehydrogenase (short-subunit alcohol dehydrogenase family)
VELTGKRILITGGGSGIGRATALLMAERGAHVAVADVNETSARSTAEAARALGASAMWLPCDVSDEQSVVATVDAAVEQLGGLDAAVNNAGVDPGVVATAKHTLAEWRRLIDINLTGVFLSMKYEIPRLLRAGGGSIVNTSSIAGRQGFAGKPAYVASKHGVIGLTKSAALEYGTRGIRVNAVCPGTVRTPMFGELDDTVVAELTRSTPLRRLGEPSELAEMIAWLCSDYASYCTGAEFVVDGGISCG